MYVPVIEPGLFEVAESRGPNAAWYTASRQDDGSLFVMSGKSGRAIKVGSAIHHRVQAAVDGHVDGRR